MTYKYEPVWTPEALELTREIIFQQDTLMTGLANCVHNIKINDYTEFVREFGGVPFVVSLIAELCEAVIKLRTKKRGPKPQWYEWAEHVKYFCLEIKRISPTIQREIWDRKWEVIRARLIECHQRCLEFQTGSGEDRPNEPEIIKKGILSIIPNDGTDKDTYVSQRSVIQWLNFIKTLDMAGNVVLTEDGNFRYRRNK
jgi:hypothetical protein